MIIKFYLSKIRLVRAVILAGIIIIIAGSTKAQELITKPEWLPESVGGLQRKL